MTELNIKKEIGKRILEARKAKGLTLKALGELAGGLKQTRLTNWEQGVRTPGPEEIKSLAQALDVSPAYLMCLSDEKRFKEVQSPSQLVPLLTHYQACEALLHIQTIREQENPNNITLISVSMALLPVLSADAFALKMLDDSMIPEIRINDIQVIDPNAQPNPGDYVAVKVRGKEEAIICVYKKLSYTSSQFELLTLNDNWPDIKVSDIAEVNILGKLVLNIRTY
ncbi:TPA: S24 family peptidase [Legionella pneumophila]|uniref:Helix-turn-helix domain-containing protein n=1 Tax=Legionella pneumophila TaxID=446 RepID=A0A2S6F9S4_LEGPN|nr:S24 family peptidase [Legionella pneumophila]HAT9422662.1 helix-turn-helix domain-containing protein [Legionella pneumophila subsp. pneumophila]MCW8427096.1 helix-turn-helix domain-containing protein [Legionella pneumophila]PPK34142.1 helix-turn-helix domain-containing protein [Legionella pneumophila]TIH01845.1 helix-turn-helix domain-containing protein [Legionella pneumophila]CZG38369.1 transcriptional repressor DicA [Legionella pneumophila]